MLNPQVSEADTSDITLNNLIERFGTPEPEAPRIQKLPALAPLVIAPPTDEDSADSSDEAPSSKDGETSPEDSQAEEDSEGESTDGDSDEPSGGSADEDATSTE